MVIFDVQDCVILILRLISKYGNVIKKTPKLQRLLCIKHRQEVKFCRTVRFVVPVHVITQIKSHPHPTTYVLAHTLEQMENSQILCPDDWFSCQNSDCVANVSVISDGNHNIPHRQGWLSSSVKHSPDMSVAVAFLNCLTWGHAYANMLSSHKPVTHRQ